MPTPIRALPPVLTLVCLSLLSGGAPVSARQATNDLDQFMAVVLKRRDDNWRKLQQYILEERETADFFAPGKVRLFGMDREYSWFIRDGVFVRSPVKFDGVTLSESDRRKAEDEWIAQEKHREKEDAAQAAAVRQGAPAPAFVVRRLALVHRRDPEVHPRAAVRLVVLLPAFQVRARSLRPGRPRDLQRPSGASHRVLPAASLRR